MGINYKDEAEKYMPTHSIRALLVAEAPPSDKKSYFYVPKAMNPASSIENQRNLAATVFWHYFHEIPGTRKDYERLLKKLKKRRIFLVDICDEPIRVRNSPEGLARIKSEIPKLRRKLKDRGITISEDKIVFLHARRNYSKYLRSEFRESKHTCWMCFRMNWE